MGTRNATGEIIAPNYTQAKLMRRSQLQRQMARSRQWNQATEEIVMLGRKKTTTRSPSTSSTIAVDLGASRTRFYCPEQGLILDEPSLGLLDMDHQDLSLIHI